MLDIKGYKIEVEAEGYNRLEFRSDGILGVKALLERICECSTQKLEIVITAIIDMPPQGKPEGKKNE